MRTVGELVDIWTSRHDPTTEGYAALQNVRKACANMTLDSFGTGPDAQDIMIERLKQRGERLPEVAFKDFEAAWDWAVARGLVEPRTKESGMKFADVVAEWIATLTINPKSIAVYAGQLRRCDQGYTLEQAGEVACPHGFPGSKNDARIWRRVMEYAVKQGYIKWSPNLAAPEPVEEPALTVDLHEEVPCPVILEDSLWAMVTAATGASLRDQATNRYLLGLIHADLSGDPPRMTKDDITKRSADGLRTRFTLYVPRELNERIRARRGLFTLADYVNTLVVTDLKPPEVFDAPPPPVSDDSPFWKMPTAKDMPADMAKVPKGDARKQETVRRTKALASALNLDMRSVIDVAVANLYFSTFGAPDQGK